jgi:hypothetical protein
MDPTFINPNTDALDPALANERTLRELPTLVKETTLILDPALEKLRKDKEDAT